MRLQGPVILDLNHFDKELHKHLRGKVFCE